MDVKTLLSRLKSGRDSLLPFYDLDAKLMQSSYAPGKWNICQLLHHVADAESVLCERIKRTIANPGQVIWAFDQDAWALQLEYQNQPLEIAKDNFEAMRNTIIYLAAQYYQSCGHFQYIHNETGMRTLKEEFEKVALHSEHHLSQIKQALSV